MKIIKASAMSVAGPMPVTKKVLTESVVIDAKTIMTMLGGMVSPIAAAEDSRPIISPGAWPRRSISGTDPCLAGGRSG